MRPTKLTPKLLHAFKSVLDDDDYMRVCTDIELCHLINKKLDDDEQISYRTFQRYKAVVQEHTYTITHKEKMGYDYEIYRQLYRMWMDARIAQKLWIMKQIQGKVPGWQRYRWLLERKFPEFSANPNTPPQYSYDYAPTLTDHGAVNRYRNKLERDQRLGGDQAKGTA